MAGEEMLVLCLNPSSHSYKQLLPSSTGLESHGWERNWEEGSRAPSDVESNGMASLANE